MRIHHTAAALFVTFLSMPALALSLGASQGSAWIGQPLDLRVPLSLDGADAGGSLCTQVELRQGDTGDADTHSGVQAVLEPGASPDRPLLRVRSSRPISEPVVNLRVKVGCQGSSSREFVLLADPPPVLAGVPAARTATAAVSSASMSAASRANETAPAGRTALRAGAGAATPAAPSERSARAARQAERPRQPQTAAAPAGPSAPRLATRRASAAAPPLADATRGRLQLDALEPRPQPPLRAARWGEAGVSTLKVPLPGAGSSALTGASMAPATGTDPSASMATTPRASPTLAEVERTTQLEAALAELRAEARQSQQTQAQLRNELADARDIRYSNPLVYVLSLLLLLLALAVGALWRAGRRVPESPWAEAVPRDGAIRRRFKRRGAQASADAEDEAAGHVPMYFPNTISRRGQPSDEDEDEDEDEARTGGLDASDSTQGALDERTRRSADSAAPARALDVDELLDVQQQAEFFTSLGQHEQAIEALRHYVNEHPQASALAYLELLHLYHQTQREADYEQLRQQCQQGLNVRLPGFHEFGAVGGRTLDNYPEVWARLQSHWPHPTTLEVIEELLFRRGTDDDGEAFDLAAYRELLMLYALVQEQSFAAGQEWPSLDDLLRLPRRDSETPVPALAASAVAGTAPATADPFNLVLDPQRGDFQPTWPPALLDLDLERLESSQIDTIPVALRRAPTFVPAQEAGVLTTVALDLPELSLEPRADLPPLPKPDSTAANADNEPDSDESSKGPTRAYLR